MSRSSNRKRTKTSALLAALSIFGSVSNIENNLVHAYGSSSRAQEKGTAKLSYAPEIFLLDKISSNEEAEALVKRLLEMIDQVHDSVSAATSSSEQLIKESAASLPEGIGWGQRIYARIDSSTVDKKSETMSQICKKVHTCMHELIENTDKISSLLKDIENFLTPFVEYKKLSSMQKTLKYVETVSESMGSLHKDFASKIKNASSESGISKYDSLTTICKEYLPRITECTSDLLKRTKEVDSMFNDFAVELKTLPELYDARQKRLEEENMSAQERAEREKEKQKKAFSDNKLKWLASFSDMKKKVDSSFTGVYKSSDNSDADIEKILYKKFKIEFENIERDIDREMAILNGISEFNDAALMKTSGVDNRIFQLETKLQQTEDLARKYKNDLNEKKEELIKRQNRAKNKVNSLKAKLEGVWNEEIEKLDQELAERFKSETGSIYSEATLTVTKLNKILDEVEIQMDAADPSYSLEVAENEVNSKTQRIEECIGELVAKGFELKIFSLKKEIVATQKKRDEVWEAYKAKYMPGVLPERLREESKDVWDEISKTYDGEKAWEEKNELHVLLKDESRTKELFDRLYSLKNDCLGHLTTFKRKIENAVLDMQKLVEMIKVDEDLKASWSRIFAPEGAADKIREKIGDASGVRSEEDCDKIATEIDRWLPGTKDLMLKMTDILMRTNEGSKFVYVHGKAGWGKTRSIQYLASAIGADIVRPDKDMFKKMDGAAYAHLLMDKYKGKKIPVIVLMDEFDSISTNRDKNPDNTISATVNVFLNTLEEIGAKGTCNFKLGVFISNIPSNRMDSAHMDRMDLKEILGDKADYKRIIQRIAVDIPVGAAEGTKEHFISTIANRCEDLKVAGRAPSPRLLIKVLRGCQDDWCKVQNRGLSRGQKGWKEPWHAKLLSEEVIARINAACDSRL